MIVEILTYAIVSAVIVIIPSVSYANITTLTYNKYKLNKLSKSGYIIDSNISKPNERTTLDKNQINRKIYEYVLPYVEKLKNYTSEENLETLYNNLKTLEVKKQPLLTAISYLGTYSPSKNEIKCVTKNSFGHELLHAASSEYDAKTEISYSGFKQYKDGVYIGQGLNEGYTELLASRIYNKKNKVETYKKEAKIAKLIEFFFDDPKEMEKYYFSHNLPGFIHYMESYANRQDIIELILGIDNINTYSRLGSIFLPTYDSIKIQLKLYNWYSKNCTNPHKIEEFRNLVCENKMASIILNNQKTTINRNTPKQATSCYKSSQRKK